ncbi:SMP-30/gluconolactonase/LRE family protein [[Mycobacterium] crassicus]|uniref:SMP-30/gluconolactonase/LRE family protein n=1 Tax=[Mycobacterium] crassicus TaxID=2872309 RepID=A0ABU5XIS1_9MYCO|nr:SMP-30/gluconolactonase/LRE family protein [Mycolicibacter sp. MYC098]MEB3022180.1 SMP-30/gluconolactonase/LRE family protein [Mycolicibacter sp. MYC098]
MKVVAEGLVFPECPRWHDGALWFSDQHAGTVFRLEPGHEREPVLDVDGQPSGLGWTPDGDLLVVSMLNRTLLRYDGQRTTTVADLSPYHRGPSNDMLVDDAGRAYIGDIGFDYYDGGTPTATKLVMVDPDGVARVVSGDVLVPNGMALTDGGTRLIVAESLARRLTSFRREPDGTLSDQQVFADLGRRVPDGICADLDDAVWFASPNSKAVVCVDRNGTEMHVIDTGSWFPVACELGGPDRRTLYICASTSVAPKDTGTARSGVILAVRLDDTTT